MSEDISECRICFEIETYDDPFISPCRCKGTSSYVHKSCLNTWRNLIEILLLGKDVWNVVKNILYVIDIQLKKLIYLNH